MLLRCSSYKIRMRSKKRSSVTISEIIEGGNILASLSERVLGRVIAEDIKNPVTGEVLIKKEN